MIKSLLRITHTYTKYNKFKISRLPNEQFVTLLPDEATLSQLFQHIKYNFDIQNTQLLAASAFTPELSRFPITPQLHEANKQIINQPFLPLFLSSDLYIYEVNKDKALLIYGLECLELNPTNNRNLPQKIQTGIIQMYQQWETTNTIGQALTMPAPTDQKKPELQDTLQKTFSMIEMTNKLKMPNPVNEFVKKMTLLMGTNWIFLYAVTFGYYGWDVGQPISYLTAVGVDLMALLGVFDVQKKINFQIASNEGRWMGLLNLSSQKRMHRWLHCYVRRHLV